MPDDSERFESALRVGTTVIFSQEEVNPQGERWRTVIRGWRRGDYILLELAPGQKTMPILRQNHKCELRFVSRGSAQGIESMPIDAGAGAYRSYFRVEWPQRVSSVGMRKSARIQTELPCHMEYDDNIEQDGQVLDLSALGCQLQAEEPVTIGHEVKLTFTLPDGTEINQLKAIVRNTSYSRSHAIMGCQFMHEDTAVSHSISLCVATTIDRLRGTPPNRHRIVIVEPQPGEEVESLAETLRQKYYEVLVVADVVDAAFLARISRPAAVLARADMPGLAGPALCRLFRQKTVLKDLPFFTYGTGSAQAEDAGISGHFDKIGNTSAILTALAGCAPPPANPDDDADDSETAHLPVTEDEGDNTVSRHTVKGNAKA